MIASEIRSSTEGGDIRWGKVIILFNLSLAHFVKYSDSGLRPNQLIV